MFFLKKKYFDKFKKRYNTINIVFVRPDLSSILDNKGFYIKIKNKAGNTTEYYYGSARAAYTLKTNTYIDRPITFRKLVDLLEEAKSMSDDTGFQVRLSLRKEKEQNAAIVGYIKFAIINNNGNIYLSSITYEDSERQEFSCNRYIDENSNTGNVPNIFFGRNTNYTGDIANIVITEDYFDPNTNIFIQLAIANLNVVVENKITN